LLAGLAHSAVEEESVLLSQEVDLGGETLTLLGIGVDLDEATLGASPLSQDVRDLVDARFEVGRRPLDRIQQRPEAAIRLGDNRRPDANELAVEAPERPFAYQPLEQCVDERSPEGSLLIWIDWDGLERIGWSRQQLLQRFDAEQIESGGIGIAVAAVRMKP
jgi:hypothetical protein